MNLYKEEITFISIISAIIVLTVLFFYLSFTKVRYVRTEVTLQEKTYSPASTGIGTHTSTNSKGGVSTGVVVTSSSEKYVVLMKTEAGGLFSVPVDSKQYVEIDTGKVYILTCKRSKVTGSYFGYNLKLK